ncbi:hypothetical protein ALC62_11969, partial [Cyphomyrmex costatus]
RRSTKTPCHLEEIGARLPDAEPWHTISVLNSFGQRELDLGVVELLYLGSAAVCSLYNLHLDYLYGMGTCTMTSTHVSITLSYRSTDREVPVFPIHVVSALWISACGRKDLLSKKPTELYNNYRICRRHFEKKMFLNYEQTRLQLNAVPSIIYDDNNSKFL